MGRNRRPVSRWIRAASVGLVLAFALGSPADGGAPTTVPPTTGPPTTGPPTTVGEPPPPLPDVYIEPTRILSGNPIYLHAVCPGPVGDEEIYMGLGLDDEDPILPISVDGELSGDVTPDAALSAGHHVVRVTCWAVEDPDESPIEGLVAESMFDLEIIDVAGEERRLAAARATWTEDGPDDYVMEYSERCFCGFVDHVVVTVIGDKVTDIQYRGGDIGIPFDPTFVENPLTVERILDNWEESLVRRPFRYEVSFATYSTYRVPVDAYFDYDRQIQDEEWGWVIHSITPYDVPAPAQPIAPAFAG